MVMLVLVLHTEPRVAAVVTLHEACRQGTQHSCASGGVQDMRGFGRLAGCHSPVCVTSRIMHDTV